MKTPGPPGSPLLLALLLLLAGTARVAADGGARDLDELVARLDREDPASAELAATLGTLAGRLALAERLDEVAADEERARRATALATLLGGIVEAGADDAPSGRPEAAVRWRWLEARRRVWNGDLAVLDRTLARLCEGLVVDSAVAGDLRRFLGSQDAARLLWTSSLRDRVRPDPLRVVLARYLVPDDQGRLHVPAALRESAAVEIDRLQSIDLVLPASLADPDSEDQLRTARWMASRLAQAEDPLLAGWRELLLSPRVLALSGLPAAAADRGDVAKRLLEETLLGRALVVGEDGSVRVNPHAVGALDALLLELQRDRTAYAFVDEALAAVLGDEEGVEAGSLGTPAGRAVLADLGVRAAGEGAVDALDAWHGGVLEEGSGRLRVREERRAEVADLRARAARIEPGLAADRPAIRLALGSLPYDTKGLDTWRSSVFLNPRTPTGWWIYETRFDDHEAARLFGFFGWDARVSKDLDDFRARLARRRSWLEALAATHHKLIFLICGVPTWLSASDDPGSFEGGGWKNRSAHPPKDVEVWKTMVRETAELVRSVGGGVERYYEFWNEPDLEYWQGTLEEFLDLYAVTARTLREADPEGRIGGCGVNQWDGTLGKGKQGPRVIERWIRYCALHDLPMDFVSWHHFGRPVEAIGEAKASFDALFDELGVDPRPEHLVTEWSVPGRGTAHVGPGMAERLLAFRDAGVAAQTMAAWEEFHAKPASGGFAPWGMITQQGHAHDTYHVHRVFDRLARDSEGTAVVRPDEETTIVVSRERDGTYELVAWRRGASPRVRAAWEALAQAGVPREALRTYGTADRLLRAVEAGEAPEGRWAEAFARARAAAEACAVRSPRMRLTIPDAERLEVLDSESIRMGATPVRATVWGRELSCPLDPPALLHLRLRVRVR